MNGSGLDVGGPLQLVKEGMGSQDEGGLLEGEELLVQPLVYRAHVVVAISIVVSGASAKFNTTKVQLLKTLFLQLFPPLFLIISLHILHLLHDHLFILPLLLLGPHLAYHPLPSFDPFYYSISTYSSSSGIAGASSNFSLLVIHFRLKERLLDPSGESNTSFVSHP